MDAQQYVDEEEDLGDGADREADLLTGQGQTSWFKGMRRNTQIAPEGIGSV